MTTFKPITISLSLAICLVATMSSSHAQEPGDRDAFRKQVLPLLERYCVDCHSVEDNEAGIILDRFEDQAAAVEDGRTWLRVRDVLEAGSMPPADKPQPSLKERETLSEWIEKDFFAAQSRKGASSPPVVIRRLNRQEYNNTIRDLLGIDLRLADLFPPDDIGFGFDNVGSALNISPIHVEKYLDAAEMAVDRAILLPDASQLPPIELIGLKTYPLPPDKPVEFKHTLKPGRYQAEFSLVRVGIAESVPPPRLVVGFAKDRRTVEAVRVQDETVVYRYWLEVAEGDDLVHISLAPKQTRANDSRKTSEVDGNVSGDQRYGADRGLHVDSIVVRGPVPPRTEKLPTSQDKILFRKPGLGDQARLESAREVIAKFTERAYRRPVLDEEVDRVLRIFRLAYDRGESFERCVQVALTSVLASPRFLFLVEPEESHDDRPLSDFELASRLSYFLWSSMPDDELFREARQGTLRANIRRQTNRMLDDPKSEQLVENFAGQWLQLRRLGAVTPDKDLFPGFDETLRDSMRLETEHYFSYILREDRSILELMDSDYAFVNGAMARHYGIEGVSGEGFQKVVLADRRRGGLLTQASVLTLTSNPNRTSPVKRGQWILQQLLGTPPPPPPPDVAKLDESRNAADASSLRERMEVHRANPQCASCHQQMDPLGFALENFDAVGRWRTMDGPFRIEPAGELAGGRKFKDVEELKHLLGSADNKKFARNLIVKLMTYGLGRGVEPSDYGSVEEIRGKLAADHFKIRDIFFGIVESRSFQYRGQAR